MRVNVVTVPVISIDAFSACLNLKFLSQIFSGHAIMNFAEGEAEILCC